MLNKGILPFCSNFVPLLSKGTNYLSQIEVICFFGQRAVIEVLGISVSGHFNYENKALLLNRYCSKMD